MLTVVAEIICAAETDFVRVLESFKKIRPRVLQEAGCYGYDIYIDDLSGESAMQAKVPYSIIMYEKWETRQDLETHMHSVNMKAHQEAIQGAVLQVQVRILEQVV
ncbi:antibiotic biosynthesis monooxygenase [Acinetobacter sp. CWB-B33]|uniref:putative quinol monooxygenase n=1 Tax=Acinetobacter sp. CWB-B33 TaxID=2815724 RepID=UPI0031FF3F94